MTLAYKTLPRLYVPTENISRGETCALSEGQHHYLRNVMRLTAGDKVRAFNGRNGEWLAELTEISKKNALISFIEKTGEQFLSPDLLILASPIKKEALDFMIEKSTELGAAQFQPVLCEHTSVNRINRERLQSTAIEAAEQCERLDVMEVGALAKLEDILNSWPSDRKLIFCVERADALPLAHALGKIQADTPLAILVGPEGGFSEKEISFITAQPYVVPVSLGARILKAETALVAALAVIQAFYYT